MDDGRLSYWAAALASVMRGYRSHAAWPVPAAAPGRGTSSIAVHTAIAQRCFSRVRRAAATRAGTAVAHLILRGYMRSPAAKPAGLGGGCRSRCRGRALEASGLWAAPERVRLARSVELHQISCTSPRPTDRVRSGLQQSARPARRRSRPTSSARPAPPGPLPPPGAPRRATPSSLLRTGTRRRRRRRPSRCRMSRLAAAPPVAWMVSTFTRIHDECIAMAIICASMIPRTCPSRSCASRPYRLMPGSDTAGVISGSNHGSSTRPPLPGGVVRRIVANSVPRQVPLIAHSLARQ